MKKLLCAFLMVKCVFSSLDLTTVDVNFGVDSRPIFKNHNHELNWWLDKLKSGTFKLVNTTDAPVSLQIFVKTDYPKPSWGDLPAEAPRLDGYSFAIVEDTDKDGNLSVSAQTQRLKFSKHYSGCNKVSVFQTREIILPANETQEFALTHEYSIREIQSKDESSFVNLSLTEGVFQLSVSKSSESARASITDLILLNNYLDQSNREFYETDSEYAQYSRPLEYFYRQAGLTRGDVQAKRQILVERSKEIVSHIGDSSIFSDQGMPRIIHRIWYTHDEAPQEIARKRLDHYLMQVAKHNDFKHILWVRNKDRVPNTVDIVQRSGLPVSIREISEIWPEIRGKAAIDRCYRNRKIVAITDILRFNLIYLFGGIYADMGIQLEIDPKIITDNFTSVSLREGAIYGTSMVGGTKSHAVFNQILEYVDNIDRTPSILREYVNDTFVPFLSLPLLTAKFDTADESTLKHLHIQWNKGIVAVNNTGSWLSTGKFPQSIFFEGDPFGDGYRKNDEGWFLRFTIPMARQMYAKGIEQLTLTRAKLMETCRMVYTDFNPTKIFAIPHITHRSWLTNPESPSEVPQDKLESYFKSIKSFKAVDWQHFFWCFDPDKIPETIRIIRESELPIEIHTVSEIRPSMKAGHLFDAMIEDRRYTNANDILRMNIVYQNGGLYSDIGMEYNIDFTSLTDEYEYFWCLRDHGNIDHNLFAARANDPLLEKHLLVIDKLYDLPASVQSITQTAHNQLTWTGCHHLMALIDSTCTGSEKMLFVKEGNLFKLNNLDSWQGKALFGNKAISESTLNIFSVRP